MPVIVVSDDLYFHLMRIAEEESKRLAAEMGEGFGLEADDVADEMLWNEVKNRPDFAPFDTYLPHNFQGELPDLDDGIPF